MKKEVIGLTEKVVLEHKGSIVVVKARIDTGARYSSIDTALAERLGLIPTEKKVHIRAAAGKQHRHTAHASLSIRGRKIKSLFTITDRSHMKYHVLIGTRTLKGRFLIDPELK